ncbi:hypothetical protein niasHT_010385 [Heterodera trifolii]|uniref:Fido domain-containing protein n=1 Tax=Heterodera trifolii TaxID=157864 RepID=A0ABD2MBF0_9BILA
MVLDMHKDIMWKTNPLIAGDLRLTEIDVRDHSGASAAEVPAKMAEFVAWFNSHEHTTTIHSLVAEVHYRLTYIHPFYDGNGRCCRFLSNFVLARKGFNPVLFDKEMRKEYNAALSYANKTGGPGARTLDLSRFTNLYAHLIQNAEFF